MDYVYLGLALFFGAQILWAWSLRGGSLPDFIPSDNRVPKVIKMAVTPLFASLAVASSMSYDLSLFQWGYLATYFALFYWAQVPGLGRQFDLGRDHKRDDEWGWQIRDMIYGKEKPRYDAQGVHQKDAQGNLMYIGNYDRDLMGLRMRFGLWFTLAAIPAFFVHPVAIIVPLVFAFWSPQVWVSEYKHFWSKDKIPSRPFGFHSWVEWHIGIAGAGAATIQTLVIFFLEKM